MKFIPILFSTAMVQAILEGRKTQTRREVRPQPSADTFAFSFGKVLDGSERRVLCMHKQNLVKDKLPIVDSMQLPYGEPGDVLWVRESFCEGLKDQYYYKAQIEAEGWDFKWKPSIHMPKSACRIFLEVVSVRVERLRDISQADAIAEGIVTKTEVTGLVMGQKNDYPKSFVGHKSWVLPKESFKGLWKSINGQESWDSNPWVWVVEFKRIEKPENFK